MMWQEFERIAGYEVSYEDYTNIIEPMYMATNLSKTEFVKTLNRKTFEKKPVREVNMKRMCVRDRSGFMKTPNGCWYHIEWVNLIDVDIKTGKVIVAPLTDEDLDELIRQGRDTDLSTGYDFDYTECLDTKRKPIVLKWWF